MGSGRKKREIFIVDRATEEAELSWHNAMRMLTIVVDEVGREEPKDVVKGVEVTAWDEEGMMKAWAKLTVEGDVAPPLGVGVERV